MRRHDTNLPDRRGHDDAGRRPGIAVAGRGRRGHAHDRQRRQWKPRKHGDALFNPPAVRPRPAEHAVRADAGDVLEEGKAEVLGEHVCPLLDASDLLARDDVGVDVPQQFRQFLSAHRPRIDGGLPEIRRHNAQRRGFFARRRVVAAEAVAQVGQVRRAEFVRNRLLPPMLSPCPLHSRFQHFESSVRRLRRHVFFRRPWERRDAERRFFSDDLVLFRLAVAPPLRHGLTRLRRRRQRLPQPLRRPRVLRPQHVLPLL
mmetsp:Transcript_25595/g.78731  ORF Transcript_25595/g.78731 Transcript_25595/m.78731 type:complete len:258 (+) Transcript_25595:1675-2448(+)